MLEAAVVTQIRSISNTGRLDLGPITLLVGRNNSGKSALLRALLVSQGHSGLDARDRRIGSPDPSTVTLLFSPDSRRAQALARTRNLPHLLPWSYRIQWENPNGGTISTLWMSADGNQTPGGTLPIGLPDGVFVPVFSRRKALDYSSDVNRSRAVEVSVTDHNLTSRIDALSSGNTSEGRYYRELVQRVLGLDIATFVTDAGKQPGLVLSSFDGVPLDRLGEGVSSALTLLSTMAYQDREYVFLLEEPENDLHPSALRALLDVVIEGVRVGHQFIVSTHSDLVVRHLGSVKNSVVYATSMEYQAKVPTSQYERREDSLARRETLIDLGYTPSSALGWLILEESTAQAIISRCLIPLFTPELADLRIVAASGVEKVEAHFEDLYRTVLFLHLDNNSNDVGAAWVVVDGDEKGSEAVKRLHSRFKSWPKGRFKAWSVEHFEQFYPENFQAQVVRVLDMKHGAEKQEAKAQLVEEVKAWFREDPERSREPFERSAREVIDTLMEIRRTLGVAPIKPLS